MGKQTARMKLKNVTPLNMDPEQFQNQMSKTVKMHPVVIPKAVEYVEEQYGSISKVESYETDELLEESEEAKQKEDKDLENCIDFSIFTEDGQEITFGNRVRPRYVKGYFTGLSLRAEKGDVFSSDDGFVHRGRQEYSSSEVYKIITETMSYPDYIVMTRHDEHMQPHSLFIVDTDELADMMNSDELHPVSPTRRTPARSSGGKQAFYFDFSDFEEAIQYKYNYVNELDALYDADDDPDKEIVPDRRLVRSAMADYIATDIDYATEIDNYKSKLLELLVNSP